MKEIDNQVSSSQPPVPERPVGWVISPGRVWDPIALPTTLACLNENSPTLSPAARRGWIVATLFLVTGVLGVPLLWQRDPKGRPLFGAMAKWIWTVLVTVYTIGFVTAVVVLVRYTMDQAIPPPG